MFNKSTKKIKQNNTKMRKRLFICIAAFFSNNCSSINDGKIMFCSMFRRTISLLTSSAKAQSKWKGDVDEDGDINVTDVRCLVNMVINGQYNA